MTTQNFIEKYGLNADYTTFERELNSFVADMNQGLMGADSSLKMIPTYISLDNVPASNGEKVIVIDAGGTNLRVGLATFDETGKPSIVDMQVYPMLGTTGAITVSEFFEGLAEYLAPYADKSDKIGFCFSFPCEILPNMDGKILLFNKEVKISGASGQLLGEGIRAALKAKGLPCNHSVVIINDTVATLLGGKADSAHRQFESYIGYILGTGTNTCYVEKNEYITKNETLRTKDGWSLINMESGGYGRMNRTSVDMAFDLTTDAPNTQWLEKMISGAYQGGLLLAYLKKAAQEGVFAQDTAAKILSLDELKAKEIDEFCYYPYADGKLARLCESEEEKQDLYKIIDAFFNRAAMMTVVNLAGVMVKTKTGTNPLMPVCITADGSTFYKSKLLNEKIRYLMVDYVQNRLGIYSEFKSVENVTLVGTAFAALIGGR